MEEIKGNWVKVYFTNNLY